MKSFVALACCLLLSASGLSAQITSIPAANMINPVVLDFDTGSPPPPGVVSGTDPYFLAIGLSQVSLVGTTTAGGDQLDTYPQGNALCAVNNQLAIVAPNTPMDNIPVGSGWSFQISGTATQIGFNSVDQSGHTIDIQTFVMGQPVGNLVITWSFTTTTQYYQSAVPFDEVRLVSSTSTTGWGLDNVTFGNLQTGPPPSAYQINTSEASLTINAATGTTSTPATVTIGVGSPTLLQLTSSNLGMPWELGFGIAPLVPASAGGFTTAGNQILNLDLTDPTFGVLWNYFQSPGFVNVPIPFSVPNPASVSVQMLVVAPTLLDGVAISQPTRLIVQ